MIVYISDYVEEGALISLKLNMGVLYATLFLNFEFFTFR